MTPSANSVIVFTAVFQILVTQVARPPTYMSAERLMTLTLAECSQHARQCKEYSSKTDSKEVRKFLLRMEKVWIKLAAEKEAEVRVGARLGT
jgi:hypothetical protein